ncbi:hypothetical protein BKD09_42155 [Bradyrhizobium japonicum]|uniref:Uncharacterized protein n=1 Tax=Bradyrhizobium japonicum TaxID=375 RepID=A0A1L3FNM6_BRAJP|nr:hypothetical protein BKD09_42155 [Bradyrhizobium japonicum]
MYFEYSRYACQVIGHLSAAGHEIVREQSLRGTAWEDATLRHVMSTGLAHTEDYVDGIPPLELTRKPAAGGWRLVG